MKSIRLNRVIITALMGMAGIFFILPFLWMLSASFKPELEVMTYPIQWIPSTWKIVENYSQVWLGSIPVRALLPEQHQSDLADDRIVFDHLRHGSLRIFQG
ncbi:hypothetical protein HMSSN036_29610 [Paenibacillus macerans]|nr:hypothetical protein HMSSN036_29610 [Paenibacillus macerans]